jgi:hypothetical protein
MTARWLPIQYRDFYDIPRMLVVEYANRLYLFDAPFDDEADAYADHYTVYRLAESSRNKLELDSWASLTCSGEKVGLVPVATVEFDESRISDRIFRSLGVGP